MANKINSGCSVKSTKNIGKRTRKNTKHSEFVSSKAQKHFDSSSTQGAGHNASQSAHTPKLDEVHCSMYKQFAAHNCFERSREKDGGVDESEEPEGDDEGDDQHHQHQSAKVVQHDVFVESGVQNTAPARITIKDIINNNKAGVPAKSVEINNLKKREEKEARKALSDAWSTSECKLALTNETTSTKNEVAEPSKVVSFHKRIIIVNGRPQIDQSSLIIEESQLRKEEDNPSHFKVINESIEARTSSLIYAKRTHTKKWTQKETDFFYDCLKICGTDFSMMEAQFKGARTRNQIKNKFKKEENEKPTKIDHAIFRRNPAQDVVM